MSAKKCCDDITIDDMMNPSHCREKIHRCYNKYVEKLSCDLCLSECEVENLIRKISKRIKHSLAEACKCDSRSCESSSSSSSCESSCSEECHYETRSGCNKRKWKPKCVYRPIVFADNCCETKCNRPLQCKITRVIENPCMPLYVKDYDCHCPNGKNNNDKIFKEFLIAMILGDDC